jgi:tetratricopeptide (TPR) repeat protein
MLIDQQTLRIIAISTDDPGIVHETQTKQTNFSPTSSAFFSISKITLFLAISFILAASFPFFLSWNFSEWYIDELFAITRNPDAKGETSFLKVLQHDFWGNYLWDDSSWTHKSYRPIITLSYWFQFHINSYFIRPEPLRIFNALLNSATSLLVFILLKKYLKFSILLSTIGAAMFACHPVHTENIVYLVGRADVGACTFYLLTIFMYYKFKSTHKIQAKIISFIGVILFSLMSGFCKESGFTVYGVLFTIELFHNSPTKTNLWLLMITFGLIFVGRSGMVGGTHVGFSYVDTPIVYQKSKLTRTLTYLYFPYKYLQLLLLPWHLCWDYSYNIIPMIESVGDLRMLGIGIWSSLLFSLVSYCLGRGASASKGQASGVMIALALIVCPYIPASNLLFTVGTVIGERLLYISTVGWAVLFLYLLKLIKFPIQLLLGLSIVGFYFYSAQVRTLQWKSRVTLYGEDARNFPRSAKTLHQYGTVVHRAGHLELAKSLYLQSLSVFDDNALTDYCIAQIDVESGRFQEAYIRFHKINDGHGIGFGLFNRFLLAVDFGYCCIALGKYSEGIVYLQEGLQLNLDVPHGLNALGYGLWKLNDLDGALNAFLTGIRYDPKNIWLLRNAAAIYLLKGDIQNTVDYVNQAIQTSVDIYGDVLDIIVPIAVATQAKIEGRQVVGGVEMELFFTRMM